MESLADETAPSVEQTDFDKDAQSVGKNIETIYSPSFDDLRQATDCYSPSDQLFNDAQKASFIKTYLQKQGLYKEAPDGVTLDNQDRPLLEYYIDQDKREVSFIVHEWDNYYIGSDIKIQPVQADAIYCTAFHFDDSDKVGNLISDYDPKQNITNKKLYDAQGMRMACVSYEYIKNVPFPFITDSWNLNARFSLIAKSLCRSQKFWFYYVTHGFQDHIFLYKGDSKMP